MVYIETNEKAEINTALIDPHYLHGHPSFRDGPQTVFLRRGYRTVWKMGFKSVEGCSYDYSDRIPSWFSKEEMDAAWKAAKKKYDKARSAAFIQEYLRVLYNKPYLLLVHIVSGVNRSNGYPYRVYGYISDPNK